MLLRDIAHSRTGDKGNISNVSVIAYEMANWPLIEAAVTPERLRAAGLSGAGELEDAADSKAADTVAAEMKQRQQAPGTFPVEKKPKKK